MEVLIPAGAARVGGLTGRKCRAEYVRVISGEGQSQHGPATVYKPGKLIKPDSWDADIRLECARGIHFFLTRKEAEEY